MTYKFSINNDCLTEIDHFDGVTGNKNVYLCDFEITAEEAAVWFAVFKSGGENYIVGLENGQCFIPYECLETPSTVYLGCYAECDGDKRLSTNWIPLSVERGAYSSGTSPSVPQLELWETLIGHCVPKIGENGNWYIYNIINGCYEDTGTVSRGERGETGSSGYSPQRGIDYFTDADIAQLSQGVLAALDFNTAYNASTNKAATMADIYNAVGNIEAALDVLIGG